MPRVVLLGASVGRDWAFSELPGRVGLEGIVCEFVAHYEFDKRPALDALLARTDGCASVIVLKECAAYFPGIPGAQRAIVDDFVGRCRAAGVVPVLATVAPVVLDRSWSGRLRDLRAVTRGRPRPQDRLRALLAFNDALRLIALEERLPLLDLESALRQDAHDRSLRPELTSGDGLHLNAEAYRRLDAAAASTLTLVLAGDPSPVTAAP